MSQDLTAEQRSALDRVLDDIIPPSDDGRLPGAGALGLSAYLEGALRSTPAIWEMIVESLGALEELARRRDARGLAALSRPQQSEVIAELASSANAFPPLLMLHTFAGYYQQAKVLEALGLEDRPPHPQGYEMAPNDLSLLDAVRGRGRTYR
jgi:hypothetical protein